MNESSPSSNVLSIQLAEFRYDREFHAADGTVIEFEVRTFHRILFKTMRLEVRVHIIYRDKDQSKTEPLLFASVATVYQLEGLATEPDTESGKETVTVPTKLMNDAVYESILHARALLAVQTAATPFGRTHIVVKHPTYLPDEEGENT